MYLSAAASTAFLLVIAGVVCDAAPTSAASAPDTVARTLPLQRVPLIRDSEHNLLAYQRHHNTVLRRHARMLGYEGPTDGELLERMLKRALQVDQEEGNSLQRRKFYEGALDKFGDINALGTVEGSKFSPLGPPIERRTFFNGALDKDHQLNAEGASNDSVFQPLGPGAGPARRGLGPLKRIAATTTTVSGNNNAGFSKVVLAAAQAVPQPVLNTGTALGAQGVSYAIEGNDIGYLANFSFGTPLRNFLMLVDTGSADSWVPSTECTVCGPHKQLGKTVSSSFIASATPWQITYGSGSAAGNLCADSVAVAGMLLANHAFGVTTQESRQFASADVPFDGLIGTAQSALSNQKVLTIPESLVKTGLMTTPVMSYALGRIADGVNDGVLTVGGTNKALADAATSQTLPVSTATGFWDTAMASVNVDGKVAVENRVAILDTGTSLIFGPQADTDALHLLIPGSRTDGRGTYTVPCTTNAVVSMTFGNVNYAIDPRDITFLPVNNAALTGDCISSITGGNIGGPGTWLIGDSFLKNVVFETDITAKTITLAGRVPASKASVAIKESNAASTPQVLRVANEEGLSGVGQVGAATNATLPDTGVAAVEEGEEETTTPSKAAAAAAAASTPAANNTAPAASTIPTQAAKSGSYGSSAGSSWRLASGAFTASTVSAVLALLVLV